MVFYFLITCLFFFAEYLHLLLCTYYCVVQIIHTLICHMVFISMGGTMPLICCLQILTPHISMYQFFHVINFICNISFLLFKNTAFIHFYYDVLLLLLWVENLFVFHKHIKVTNDGVFPYTINFFCII